jgi:TetR/AcrR family transcriptional regulator
LHRASVYYLLIIQQVVPEAVEVRRRVRDSGRSRRAILDAAERLFADRGYEATSMADIGAAAKLSRATPSYFFRSKEDLYRAVLGRAFEETSELISSAGFRAGGFEEAATKAVSDYLDFLASRPSFVQLVVRECLDGGRFLEGLSQHVAALAKGMSAVGEGSQHLRAQIDPRHLLLSGISVCWFPIVAGPLTADLGLHPESKAFIEERKQQVIELLLHGALAGR